MKKKIQFSVILYILFLGININAKAQGLSSSLDALQEIARIKAFYYYLDTTSIYKTSHYEVQDSTGYKRDTIYEICVADNGSYRKSSTIHNPGVEEVSVEVNNADYNIYVNSKDSVIQVNAPVSLENSFLVIDFFSGDFYVNNIDSILVYDTTGGRKLNVFFNTNSPYIQYEMYYDSVDYSIMKLQMRIKTGVYLGNPLISVMTWTSSHSPYPFPQFFQSSSFFYSSIFFTRRNKEFVLKPAYADFELINTSGK
jgi:hypothetical protein